MKKFVSFIAKAAAAAGLAAALSGMTAGAEWVHDRYIGDINNDGEITVADLVALSRHILGEESLGERSVAAYREDVRTGTVPPKGTPNFSPDSDFGVSIETADIANDGDIDAFDMVRLRQMLLNEDDRISIFRWVEEPPQPPEPEFIDPPIYDLYGSLPSQGEAKMAVFYVDFPDCRYDYMPDSNALSYAVFGDGSDNSGYPFESMNAFFRRSSKGAMSLDGQVYTYTTKNPKYYYENDVWHIALVDELIAAFDGQVDFSQFDSDGDRTIDAILISVPTKAGDDDWWPAAGIFGGETYNRADGMNIGHVIVGNAEITNEKGGQNNFVSSYVHESGHCMGLPDFYLYTDPNDFQGMHGSGGFELMDDAICDLGAASKLMLGWYEEPQIKVYDKSMGEARFDLHDAQSDRGNCVIIPCGQLGEKYRSEFFILEYATLNGNNSGLVNEWWRSTGSGVRIYHVSAEVTGDPWFNSWKYASGEDDATNYNKGRRFIRLVGEGDDYTDNLFRKGAVIDSNTPNFKWYDSNGYQTVSTGLTITVEEYSNERCVVKISQ